MLYYYEWFIDLHKSCGRATHNQMLTHKHAILLHKLYNANLPQSDWIDLNINKNLTLRQTNFNITKINNYLVGNNLLGTRLSILNNKVDLIDLNRSLDSFKVKYKTKFLSQTIML